MKKISARSLVSLLLVLALTLASCVSADFATVSADPNFFYGFGFGPTETAAKDAAFDELVYTVFNATGNAATEKRSQVIVTPEMRVAVVALQLKPFVLEKKGQTFSAVYKLKRSVWETYENARLATLGADLGGRFQALTTATSPLSPRLADAANIRVLLDKAGVALTLRVGDSSTPLLAAAIENWVRDQLLDLKIQVTPDSGMIKSGQSLALLALDRTGNPVPFLPLMAVWTVQGYSAAPVALTTDPQGASVLSYPTDERFKNKKATLTLATNLIAQTPDSGFLAAVDAGHQTRFSYRSADDLAGIGANEVKIEGGTYTVGAVPQDRHAGSNEVPRTVTVASFYIDRYLVTNAQYTTFLEVTNVPSSQWPDYLASPEYGGPDQPVIGVTLANAQSYAAWLSGVTRETKRLPTEDEYEIAARSQQAVIFPWGDDVPGAGPRANFSGNQKFNATSPVTSFENGKNPLGLYDMVGNVWEWTSTSPYGVMTADTSFKIVKGGSWLDGPNELRISNRRAVNPGEPASDIGFRLVREGAHE